MPFPNSSGAAVLSNAPAGYVFVDYENIQPLDLNLLLNSEWHLKLFVGAKQRQIQINTANVIHQLGSRAEIFQIESCGPNALDFHIAYYLGRMALVDPAASLYVVSRDGGFDPLLRHLCSVGVVARRVHAIAYIPGFVGLSDPMALEVSAEPPAVELDDRKVRLAVQQLRKFGSSRPKSAKNLRNALRCALRPSGVSTQEVLLIVKKLIDDGVVDNNGKHLVYRLPSV